MIYMNYNFTEDLKSIREILGLSQSELAEQIGVEQVTISRNELGKTEPSPKFLESVYSYAFDKKIKVNIIYILLNLFHYLHRINYQYFI